jgi:hypothetical protein
VSFLAKIEQFCAGFIERAFAKTFPSDLEPAQIARKLVATVEAATRDDEGHLRAPGSYTVHVSPADFERLAEHQAYLERAWAELVRDLAARVGIALETEAVRVTMSARESVPLGAIDVEVAGVQAPMRLRLRTIEGVPPGSVYEIAATSRIGRGEECDIVLLDPSVSRLHAILDVEGGRAIVRDQGSTNGSFVNGRRIETQPLSDGDEVRFGNTRMRFETR